MNISANIIFTTYVCRNGVRFGIGNIRSKKVHYIIQA